MQEERFVKGPFPSITGQKLDWRLWRPEGRPRAIVQLVHGMAEHIDRYDAPARALTAAGFQVVAIRTWAMALRRPSRGISRRAAGRA